jgi:hypothetical protein
MSYVKGHARACTALAMAIIAMEHFPNAAALRNVGGGHIVDSLRAIRVRIATVAPDIIQIAFQNARIAHRGSIRNGHDALAWLEKLEKVGAASGETPDALLKKWNQECPAEAKIVGNKQMCIMNILKVNVECRTLLVNHASKFGSNSAFNDSTFTSKKIWPGYKPRLDKQRWVRWLSVSNESFHLMLRHLIQKYEATHESARNKVTKQQIERASGMASLVLGIADDVIEAHKSLPRDDIENTFIDGFVNSDPNLIMGLESALTDQDKNFDAMSMPSLCDVVLAWRKTANVSTAVASSSAMHMKVGATDIDEQ